MPVLARLVLAPAGASAFLLRRGVYKVGRTPDCDVFLDDNTVSRLHATLVVNETSTLVQDRGSRNGTYVDGQRVDQCDLKDEREVMFGSVICIYQQVENAQFDDSTVSGSERLVPDGMNISIAENRVFNLLIVGHSEKEIAAELSLSRHTVHNHVKRIYRVFGVHSRSELLSLVLNTRKGRLIP